MEESHFTPLSFGKYILIGRKSCNININDTRVSSVHCEVGSVKMEDWDMFPACTAYVEDKSSNGTWICRKEGLHSWGAYRKLTKGIKVNFSPGDFILLLPPSVNVLDYCAFSLEADELRNRFGLKHLTVTELTKRTTKDKNSSLLRVGTLKRSSSDTASSGCAVKKLCKEPAMLETCSPDPKLSSPPGAPPTTTCSSMGQYPNLDLNEVAPPPEAPPITTQSSMEQCPNCLNLFPLAELVEHSEVCYSAGVGSALFGDAADEVTATGSTLAGDHITAGPVDSPSGASDLEQCIHCLKDYSVVELVTHVDVCSKRTKPEVL